MDISIFDLILSSFMPIINTAVVGAVALLLFGGGLVSLNRRVSGWVPVTLIALGAGFGVWSYQLGLSSPFAAYGWGAVPLSILAISGFALGSGEKRRY